MNFTFLYTFLQLFCGRGTYGPHVGIYTSLLQL